MADLTPSGVVVARVASETRSNGLTFWEKYVAMTLATHGDLTAGQLIPASAFGLSTIEEVSSLVKSDDTLVLVATPSNDRQNILLKAAATNAPAAYSGVFKGVVKGY